MYNHLIVQLLLIVCIFHYILIGAVKTVHKIPLLFLKKPWQKSTYSQPYASLRANTDNMSSRRAV